MSKPPSAVAPGAPSTGSLTDSLMGLIDVGRRAGLLDPRRVPALTAAVTRWGPTLAAPYAASAFATPGSAAVIDDRGTVTFRELDRCSTLLAQGLKRLGLGRNERLGVACCNHREFVEATIAAAKLGVPIVYLNTGFAAPQMHDVLAREQVDVLIIDEALVELVDRTRFTAPVVVVGSTQECAAHVGTTPLSAVRRSGKVRLPLLASRPVAPVLLTSGTTGTPKGAQRTVRADPGAAGVLQSIPYRHDDIVAITSPLFHAWGLAQMGIAAALGATVVITETFDADATLALLEREAVTVLAVVPAILQRLLNADALDSTDLSGLRIVASSGSALPVPVVRDWLTRVGPNLYNLYGSTEVGQATLAVPEDLLADPATAGRALPGSTVVILGGDGQPVPTGSIGRIFVGNGSQFDGYTGGGGKEIVDGLMSSGDVGHLDATGLLSVTGRADDMIVSGGENVFPREVEDLLLADDGIVDVAVIGVADDDFGQRLVAHVVKAPGASLTKAEVRKVVSDNLARHKVPRDVVFSDELPRTTTGKIRRTQL
jgi:fatty-acyl-CoA synthase